MSDQDKTMEKRPPHLIVMEMVGVLLERGFQRLRILPGMSPSGMSWRCCVTHVDNLVMTEYGLSTVDYDDSATYTTAMERRYFGWEDVQDAGPERLADLFQKRFAELCARGKGADPEHVRWYGEILELARRGVFPVAYCDDEDPGPGRWRTSEVGVTVAMPPPFGVQY